MRVHLVYDYETEAEAPGRFERDIELPDRTPAIGESIEFENRFIANVKWVLWHPGASRAELHLEVRDGFKPYAPDRSKLLGAGWSE